MLVKLHDDVAAMKLLAEETAAIIHATDAIPAIKKLLNIHDIIHLNLTIVSAYPELNGNAPWDASSLKDMNRERAELVLYYHVDFKPPRRVFEYNAKIRRLFHLIRYNRPELRDLEFLASEI